MEIASVEEGVRERVRVGSVRAGPVRVERSGAGLDAEFTALVEELVSRHRGKAPGEIQGLQPARELYRAFGVDPTRTRPSSESLLRRAVQGKPMPRILNAVDVCNLCSLRFLLPIGLYDVDRLQGAVSLRSGLPGEWYEGIRKDEVHVGGRIVLADEEGPFGNPTSDSLRTSVRSETRRLWMVIFAPAGFPRDLLEEHARFAADAMGRHLGGPGEPPETQGAVLW